MSIVYKKKCVSSAEGDYNECSHKWDVNLSSILDLLIKEAAKCTRYASDLFISWEQVEELLKKEQLIFPKKFFFGFRDMGVDHLAYIQAKYDPSNIGINPDYRSIYMLQGKFKDEYTIRFDLYEIEVIGFREEETC